MSLEQPVVRVGTRGSRLALRQADEAIARLEAIAPGLEIERVIVRTVGDAILDQPLSQIGDKGLFTKELDVELERKGIDLAVHSLKDLPTAVPHGLTIGAVLARENPADVLISPSGLGLDALPPGARIGTSSLRRKAQLLAHRPDLTVLDLRGNVPTRIAKVEHGDYDAIVLALAGIVRLGLAPKITEELDASRMLPAVGQGAIAIVVREADARVASLVASLDDRPSRLAVMAERALLRRLEGGCQIPIGALGRFASGRLQLDALVADLDGSKIVRGSDSDEVATEAEAERLGDRLAQRLLTMGAREILASIAAVARSAPLPGPSAGEAP